MTNARAISTTHIWALKILMALIAILISSCETYHPLPLPRSVAPAPSLAALRHEGVSISQPLDIPRVAILAVENNPDLVAARAQRGVADAQVLQAGLLPNPQVTGALLPLVAGIGTTNAWNAAVSQDIRTLVTLSSAREAAKAGSGQINAQILWQEWQTIGQARLLAVDIIEADRLLGLLRETRDLFQRRYDKSHQAMLAGNETLASSTPDLAAVQTVTTQLDDQERQQLARQHQLNALLGLAPDVVIKLDGRPKVPTWSSTALFRNLPNLADHRPDLVALKLGFQAQNAKFRAAILSQFPDLILGLTGGSDNSNVRNLGPQMTLEVPIFNHNQGNVSIERATRQQLHDEYAARLVTAEGQVRALITEIALLSRQLASVRQELGRTRDISVRAESAFTAGNIDERSYVDLVSARFTKEQELVTVEQTLLEQQVAMATLVGIGMPAITIPNG